MIGTPARHRRSFRLAVAVLLALVLTACTGRGGGQLAPEERFTGSASFGFTFSCEDSSGLGGPRGQLRIELSYTDHGSSPGFEPFSVHGTADALDPALESAVCIGQEPSPNGGELIFLGRYWPTSSTPEELASCAPPSPAAGSCRFEVVVRDTDRNRAPSAGDYFEVTLTNVTEVVSPCRDDLLCPVTDFTGDQVLYTRGGTVTRGNLTVD